MTRTTPVRGAAAKHWVFTLNNPESDTIAWPPEVIYAIWQLESGEQNNTPHLQGFISLSCKQRQSFLRTKVSPRAHFEIARNVFAARQYVMKEQTRVRGPWTHGVLPRSILSREPAEAERVLVGQVLDSALAGTDILDIVRAQPLTAARYHPFIKMAAVRAHRTDGVRPVCFYLHGAGGLGKDVTASAIVRRLVKKPMSRMIRASSSTGIIKMRLSFLPSTSLHRVRTRSLIV